MIKVGVTGGIGSGKSVICNIFSLLGVPVFNADHCAAEILNTDTNIHREIRKNISSEVFQGDHIVRNKLAKVVFKDEKKLQILNDLIHPEVFKSFENWVIKQDTPYIIKEAAIIFETGANKFLDEVILVHASDELRINRVMKRDNVNRQQVINRMNNQLTEEKRLKLASHVIINDETAMVIPQILDIHNKLINYANKAG